MATRRTYKCTGCNFTSSNYGGESATFSGYTVTMVCNKCEDFFEHVKGFEERNGEIVDATSFCETCNTSKVYVWDALNTPCPKCRQKMEIDPEGDVCMED